MNGKMYFSSDKPLINRFNQGLYPPGSIVKMITQSRLLQNQNFDPNEVYKCEGNYQFGDRLLVVGERAVTEI